MQSIDKKIIHILSQDKDNACLALIGKWGIGKTYLWKESIEKKLQAKEQKVIYISLFGKEHYQEVLDDIIAQLQNALKKFFNHFKGELSAGVGCASFSLPLNSLFSFFQKEDFKKIIVCFDDIERKSDKLFMRDFMGLVAHLRDIKECKVVLIFNEDELKNKDEEYKIFNEYKEKCVDYFIEISNTEEVTNLIIDDEKLNDLAKNILKNKNFENLRKLKKIIRAIKDFDKALKSKRYDGKCLHWLYEMIITIGNDQEAYNASPIANYFKSNIITSKILQHIEGELEAHDLMHISKKLEELYLSYAYEKELDEKAFTQKAHQLLEKARNIYNKEDEVTYFLLFIDNSLLLMIINVYYADNKEVENDIREALIKNYADYVHPMPDINHPTLYMNLLTNKDEDENKKWQNKLEEALQKAKKERENDPKYPLDKDKNESLITYLKRNKILTPMSLKTCISHINEYSESEIEQCFKESPIFLELVRLLSSETANENTTLQKVFNEYMLRKK